jgi:hypothetical protein
MTKPGNRVGFDRVDHPQTHAQIINGQESVPMTHPMGQQIDPSRPDRQPDPIGHPSGKSKAYINFVLSNRKALIISFIIIIYYFCKETIGAMCVWVCSPQYIAGLYRHQSFGLFLTQERWYYYLDDCIVLATSRPVVGLFLVETSNSGLINLRSPSCLPQAHRCLFSLQTLSSTASSWGQSLRGSFLGQIRIA